MTDERSPSFAYSRHRVCVVFGAGALARLPVEIERWGMRRILLLTTPRRGGEREVIRALLADALVEGFDRATEHVPHDVVQEALVVVARAQPTRSWRWAAARRSDSGRRSRSRPGSRWPRFPRPTRARR